MRVLHISNAFAKNSLYTLLLNRIADFGIHQEVYCAVRTEKETRYIPGFNTSIPVNINFILGLKDKLFYRNKIYKIYRDLKKSIDVSKFDVIHAHTLYSDGAVAFRLSREYRMPYVVAVRNTDINAFSKLRPDLSRYRDKILINAEAIILISPVYKVKLEKILNKKTWNAIKDKLYIIPNGIDDRYFIHTINSDKDDDTIKIIYVGNFTQNKNVKNLIEAIKQISSIQKVKLTLVGSGGKDEKYIKEISKKHEYRFVNFIGRVDDKDELKMLYRKHDIFTMVSYHETFGIVYTEALSQGLPIIYTKNEGVDGHFAPGLVGEPVSPKNIKEICDSILRVYKRKDEMQQNCIIEAKRFSWTEIARKYRKLYQNISGINL